MRDEFHSAAWVDQRGLVGDAVHKLFAALRESMEALTRQQFDAPWRARRDGGCPAR